MDEIGKDYEKNKAEISIGQGPKANFPEWRQPLITEIPGDMYLCGTEDTLLMFLAELFFAQIQLSYTQDCLTLGVCLGF